MSRLELRELMIRRRGGSDIGPLDVTVESEQPLAIACHDDDILEALAKAIVDKGGIKGGRVALAAAEDRTPKITRFGLPLLKPGRHSLQRTLQVELKKGRVSKDVWPEYITLALSLVGLERHADWRLCDLSEGRLLRASLAASIVTKPDALLIDRPTQLGGQLPREELTRLLQEVSHNITRPVLFLSEFVRQAFELGDRVALMEGGRVLQVGTPREVYRRPVNLATAAMGGDANIVDGRVIRTGAGFILAETEAGTIQAAVSGESSLEEGASITLLIRPEAIKLERMPMDDNCLAGEIERVEFSGPIARYFFRTGRLLLKIDEAHPRYANSGEIELYALIDPDDAVALAD